MKRIRVLLANQLRLIRELIDAVAQSRPDVLIVAMDEHKNPASELSRGLLGYQQSPSKESGILL